MGLRSTVRFLRRLLWFNLRGAMAYRAAFLTGVGFMALNDTMWIVFWTMFFSRFPVIRGWTLDDVVTLWAVTAMGYGLAVGFFGNARADGIRVIISGRLDYYLSLPKSVMLHFAGGSVSVAAFGDILFGIGVYLVAVRPGPVELGLFLGLGLCAGVIMLAFGILVVSTAFWFGNTEGLGMQMQNALLTFATYPTDLFGGLVKVALFTLIPAGFTTYLPVTILRDFDPLRLAIVGGFTVGIAALATAVFYAGLRRYESGSLVATQG
jgi:ABC-2 type transport system permease protein